MASKPLKAIAGAAERPLKIGNIEIPCYVLEDETRVLSQPPFGQFHSVSRKHLQRYVDEFCYRYGAGRTCRALRAPRNSQWGGYVQFN